MGEFTQNLLKLTEFPFSYSLIGLLALIFGQGIDPQELSFAQFGPLLILMGFVATTLSICDPIGAIQRSIIKGRSLPYWLYDGRDLLSIRIFGKWISDIFPVAYLISIRGSPEYLKGVVGLDIDEKELRIDWEAVSLWHTYTQAHFMFIPTRFSIRDSLKPRRIYEYIRHVIHQFPRFRYFVRPSQNGNEPKLPEVYPIAAGRNDDDVTGNERDSKDIRKIKRDLARFSETIPDRRVLLQFYEELDKIGIRDITYLLEGLKQQTVKTKWITAEIDRITALIYFMVVISLFIVATQIYPNFLPKFAELFGNTEYIRTFIFIFSTLGLIAVGIAFRLRIKGLQAKALTVFKYLTALGTIKLSKENFKPTLDEIQRYLNDDHWPLAEYWMNRVQIDYTDLFLDKVREP